MPLLLGSWLPDVQVLVARERVGSAAGLAIAAKGGHNGENHNHNDVGSHVVACDGVPVLVDLGQSTYTSETFTDRRYEIWTMQSQWHNLPVINGVDQRAGTDYSAAGVAGTLTPEYAELRLDISGAYPVEARCINWQRRVHVDRTPAAVTIADSWLFDEPGDVAIQYVIAGEVLDHRPGDLRVRSLGGQVVALRWRPGLGAGQLERHEIDDPTLGDVWGDAVFRLGITLPDGASGDLVLTITVQEPQHSPPGPGSLVRIGRGPGSGPGGTGARVSHTVVAELVANVQKVTAKAGDTVGPEDTLVILESMKMEIPVLAEVAGTITEMKVSEGEVVRDGDPIAVIEEK